MIALPIACVLFAQSLAPTVTPDPLQITRRALLTVTIAADAATTLIATKDARATEANPLVRPFASKPALFLALQSGILVGTVYLSDHLAKEGHQKQAFVLVCLVSAIRTVAVVQNLRVIHRIK